MDATTREILDKWAADRGWSAATVLRLLCEFTDDQPSRVRAMLDESLGEIAGETSADGIPALLAHLRETLESGRAMMRRLKDVTAECNWEMWTQWEETLMRMVAAIDKASKVDGGDADG